MQKNNIKDPKVVLRVVKVLREGGIVMHPTETCYGFAVDIFNEEALKKLYILKGRDAGKPLSILVDGVKMAEKFGDFSEKAKKLARKYWPGALSIVVPRRKDLPEFFNKGEKFVSIRFSSDDFCLSMVKKFVGPLTTTSANVSGMPPLYEADLSQFGSDIVGNIDFVVDGGAILRRSPSTVVKVDGDKVEILRQGDLFLVSEDF